MWNVDSASMQKFMSSVAYDTRLLKYDLLGSMAHVAMLGKAGVLPEKEAAALFEALRQMVHSRKSIVLDPALEDVHMNLENLLSAAVGPLSRKVHTARSRNDQVAVALRMYCREKLMHASTVLTRLQGTLLQMCGRYRSMVVPGRTHFQQAQPVLLSHCLAAHLTRLQRDFRYLQHAFEVANEYCPLGACALAGTSLDTDPEYTADLLGFMGTFKSSMDAVGDRDYALVALSAMASTMLHLSSICEEMIVFMTSEFGCISPDIRTGSSAMPHKVNPDLLELVRARSAQVLGRYLQAAAAVKSLPLSYNRDLEAVKEALIDGFEVLIPSLQAVNHFLNHVSFSQPRVMDESTLSLDVVERRIRAGESMRDAYCAVKEELADGSFSPDMSHSEAVASRNVYGCSPENAEHFLRVAAAWMNDNLRMLEVMRDVCRKPYTLVWRGA